MSKPGVLTISIDYEFAWGYVDRAISPAQEEKIKQEHAIVARLINLFERYQCKATWAIVGKLLETEDGDPLWSDCHHLIQRVKESSVDHEIGSHSYAHPVYSGLTREQASEDINNFCRVHREHQLSCSSFIFPRNQIAHLDLLQQAGIKSFRGNTKRWYDYLPGLLKRLGHLLDQVWPWTPTVQSSLDPSGLVNIPDSMLLMARNGLRSLLLPALVAWKASRGLKQASAKGEIFHFWFHPSNFAYQTEQQFAILEQLLILSSSLRAQGKLTNLTMGEIAQSFHN
jgi:hypothetical protein